MFLPTDEKQFAFWAMRRSGMANIAIAKQLGISRQAVSRALIQMDEKIEAVLRDMARANSIAVEKVNAERGFLSAVRSRSGPPQSYLSPKSTGFRYGSSTKATAEAARDIRNA